MKKKIFITGANGFIGASLCEYFASRDLKVYGLVRKSSDMHFLKGINVELLYGDLQNPDKIKFPKDLDYFIHNASIVSDNANLIKCKKGIYDLTKNLIKSIQKIDLKKFVYISSALTLGYGKESISENNPGISCDFLPYAFYKKKTETFLFKQFEEKNLPLVIICPGDVFGPKDRTSCAQMLKAADKGVPLNVGKGDKKFPICYIDNLSQAVYLAVIKDNILDMKFVITNQNSITWREFFEGLTKGLGKKQRLYVPVSLVYCFAFINKLLLKIFPGYNAPVTLYRIRRLLTNTSYDISPAIKLLGYKPDEDYKQQISNIVEWYKEEKKQGRVKYY